MTAERPGPAGQSFLRPTGRLCGRLALAGLLVLAGCRAPAPRPTAFTPREEVPLAGLPSGRAGWPAQAWWQAFGDPQLDRLMDRAMAGSPTLAEAEARYRQAQTMVEQARAQLNPQVQAMLEGTHGYAHPHVPSPSVPAGALPGAAGQAANDELSGLGSRLLPSGWSNSFGGGALASWDLDAFGKLRASLAAAVGQARASEAERAAAATSLQYNLAASYYAWQANAAMLDIARRDRDLAAANLAIVEARVGAGVDDPTSLDDARSQLASASQQLARLEGQARLGEAQLAALVGVSVAELGPLTARPLPPSSGALPADASLALIARRPDLVANRWRIEAAARNVDAARAAFYPDIRLTALGAYLGTNPTDGGHAHLALFNFGPSISLPLLDGGRLTAQYEGRRAELEAAIAAYNASVVQAAQDVAQQVLTLGQLDREREAQGRMVAAARDRLARVEQRTRSGVADPRQSLREHMQLDQQLAGALDLEAQLLRTRLALIHALGGGYQADVPDVGAIARGAPTPSKDRTP
ncbi:efflux transporter outer membrane subunit [Aerosticca soli]|uniref:Outer membrane component of tripartite multidrug resistance system n=1 Tax=Aerosticca soli TaxID=2010829 RepID=A0A2Z6E1J9_9GAMM|nr:efflux transporter outer membrane subunit [Aerosticca soli]BBD78866.1 outer membrane component of tripartite multidrug resistance system [Aerosticca soli]